MGFDSSKAQKALKILESGAMAGINPTFSPFIFLAYHDDHYPGRQPAPADENDLNEVYRAPKVGNGADFDPSAAYRMYHGNKVPGFPRHPHCGLSTLTILRSGFVNHTDSLGYRAIYGRESDASHPGDAAWMYTGSGVSHSEMLPLYSKKKNHGNVYQIWYNNKSSDKNNEPGNSVIWGETVQTFKSSDSPNAASLHVYVGSFNDVKSSFEPPAGSPLPSDVAVGVLEMPPNSSISLSEGSPGAIRCIYVSKPSESFQVGPEVVQSPKTGMWFKMHADRVCEVHNKGSKLLEALVLEGIPQVGENPVVSGSFVASDAQNLRKKMNEYMKKGFGKWKFDRDDPVISHLEGRHYSVMVKGGKDVVYPPGGKKAINVDI